MNFQEFRATAQRLGATADRSHLEMDESDTRTAIVYAGDCYVMDNGFGTYELTIYNEQWTTPNLRELEARLFVWLQTELHSEMGLSDADHAALLARIAAEGEDAIVAGYAPKRVVSALADVRKPKDAMPALPRDRALLIELFGAVREQYPNVSGLTHVGPDRAYFQVCGDARWYAVSVTADEAARLGHIKP